jgi:spore germination cell wall hydrolase CwlJ-like protein
MGKDKNDIFMQLDDARLLALLIYGEARGEPMEGRIAVASVVMNRVKIGGWFGSDIKDVILKPYQFSCFNANDPNLPKLAKIAKAFDAYLAKDKALMECYEIAKKAVKYELSDIALLGATHYKTKNCKASWADKMVKVAIIGNHEFYK